MFSIILFTLNSVQRVILIVSDWKLTLIHLPYYNFMTTIDITSMIHDVNHVMNTMSDTISRRNLSNKHLQITMFTKIYTNALNIISHQMFQHSFPSSTGWRLHAVAPGVFPGFTLHSENALECWHGTSNPGDERHIQHVTITQVNIRTHLI